MGLSGQQSAELRPVNSLDLTPVRMAIVGEEKRKIARVLLLPLVVICDRLISISLMSSNFLRDTPNNEIPFFLMDGHLCEKR